MGWLMRTKLKSLPIVNDIDMETIRITMAIFGGGSPTETMKIKNKLKEYSDVKLREKFAQTLLSLAQAEAYLIDDKKSNTRKYGLISKWKLHDKALVKYCLPEIGAALGIPAWLAVQFIVRTSSDMWIAYDVPSLEFSFDDEKETRLRTFIGSVECKIFHLPDHTCAKQIPSEDTIYFDSIYDAIDGGYKPCKLCKPDPDVLAK